MWSEPERTAMNLRDAAKKAQDRGTPLRVYPPEFEVLVAALINWKESPLRPDLPQYLPVLPSRRPWSQTFIPLDRIICLQRRQEGGPSYEELVAMLSDGDKSLTKYQFAILTPFPSEHPDHLHIGVFLSR